MNKEEYKKEIVRMWDSLRDEHKGEYSCLGVDCDSCPLGRRCDRIFSFEMIEAVEKWAKEHPPKKYKVSKAEYDILQEVYSIHGNFRMYQHEIINNLREKGYFKGSYEDTEIEDYLKSCEVKEKNGEVIEND